MKFIRIIALCTIFLIGVSSLQAGIVGTNDKQIKAIADPLLDNILQGFAEDNYNMYVKDFDITLKESISEVRFGEIDAQILGWVGKYLYREYLGFLNKGETTIVFWKGVFDQENDDVLIKMVISKRNSNYLITGLWFQ